MRTEIEDVLRFWLDRGVDGFRIDVAHGLVKADGLPDADLATTDMPTRPRSHPCGTSPASTRSIAAGAGSSTRTRPRARTPTALLCAEAWVVPAEALARYVRQDELHQSFNFEFLMTPWTGRGSTRDDHPTHSRRPEAVGAPQTWVLSNHDVMRHASTARLPAVARRSRRPTASALTTRNPTPHSDSAEPAPRLP